MRTRRRGAADCAAAEFSGRDFQDCRPAQRRARGRPRLGRYGDYLPPQLDARQMRQCATAARPAARNTHRPRHVQPEYRQHQTAADGCLQGAGVSGGGAARRGPSAHDGRGRARRGAAVLRGRDAGDAAAGGYGERGGRIWKMPYLRTPNRKFDSDFHIKYSNFFASIQSIEYIY